MNRLYILDRNQHRAVWALADEHTEGTLRLLIDALIKVQLKLMEDRDVAELTRQMRGGDPRFGFHENSRLRQLEREHPTDAPRTLDELSSWLFSTTAIYEWALVFVDYLIVRHVHGRYDPKVRDQERTWRDMLSLVRVDGIRFTRRSNDRGLFESASHRRRGTDAFVKAQRVQYMQDFNYKELHWSGNRGRIPWRMRAYKQRSLSASATTR